MEKHEFKSSTMSHSKLCKRAIEFMNMTSLAVFLSTLWMVLLKYTKRFLPILNFKNLIIVIKKKDEQKTIISTLKAHSLILYEFECIAELVHIP